MHKYASPGQENSVKSACSIAQQCSLIGYPPLDGKDIQLPQEGLYRYLQVRPQEGVQQNTLLNLFRASTQLLSILFCSPFRQEPTVTEFRTERAYAA